MVRVDTLVLFLILEEMLSVFTIENNICCGFVIHGLYYVDIGLSMPTFRRVFFFFVFFHKWVLNFVERLLFICWDDCVVFILFTLFDWHILKNPCIPSINPT